MVIIINLVLQSTAFSESSSAFNYQCVFIAELVK